MNSDTVVRARIDSETKARAIDALGAMGLSISDAIRFVMLRIANWLEQAPMPICSNSKANQA